MELYSIHHFGSWWTLRLLHSAPVGCAPLAVLSAPLPVLTEQAVPLWEAVTPPYPSPAPLSMCCKPEAWGAGSVWDEGEEKEDQSRKHEKAQSTQARGTSLTSATHTSLHPGCAERSAPTLASGSPLSSSRVKKQRGEGTSPRSCEPLSRWLGPAGNQTLSDAPCWCQRPGMQPLLNGSSYLWNINVLLIFCSILSWYLKYKIYRYMWWLYKWNEWHESHMN